MEPLLGCGECRECAEGYVNRCERRTLFGVSTRGGMAEYMTIPARCAWPVPAAVALHDAVLAEPLAVCVRGFRLAGLRPGDRVAVIGAGSIGLLSIAAAMQGGAADVQFTARHEMQRAHGARARGDAPHRRRLRHRGRHGRRSVRRIDAGHGARARPGGTVLVLGVYDAPVPFGAYDLSLRELRLVGSNCYSHVGGDSDFGAALALLEARSTDLGALVTHEFPLERVNDAFEAAADKSTGSVKVVVRP